MSASVIVRRERPVDREDIRRVHDAAFPTTLDSGLLDALRADPGCLPRLSLVAVVDGAVVGLLGEPDYYRRFGFVAASELGVLSPDPALGAYFQARRLVEDAPLGTFRYAEPFNHLD